MLEQLVLFNLNFKNVTRMYSSVKDVESVFPQNLVSLVFQIGSSLFHLREVLLDPYIHFLTLFEFSSPEEPSGLFTSFLGPVAFPDCCNDGDNRWIFVLLLFICLVYVLFSFLFGMWV